LAIRHQDDDAEQSSVHDSADAKARSLWTQLIPLRSNLDTYGFAEAGKRGRGVPERGREFDESLLDYLPSRNPASNTKLQRCWIGLSQDAERISLTISVPTVGFGQPTFKYFYYGNKGQSTGLSAVVDYSSELVEFGLWTGWLAPHWQELQRHNQTKHNNTPNDRCLMAYAQ